MLKKSAWRYFALSVVVLTAGACMQMDSATGSAAVKLSWKIPGQDPGTRGVLSGIVDNVRVTVSHGSKVLVTQIFNYEHLEGTVSHIPAGSGRTFLVEARATDDTVVYQGSQSDVTIEKDQLVTVTIDMQPAYSDDVYPPGAVDDLTGRANGANIELSWTATGDDGWVGQAASYDLRWSDATIQEANFDSATQITPIFPPGQAGTIEQFSVTGLPAGGTYHLALKVVDEDGNASVMSNEAIVTTGGGDSIPPAVISDLTVTAVAETSVTLSWTAPGDDGDQGDASAYDVRYSTSQINATNFDAADAVASPPTPQTVGSTETLVIDGLTEGQQYTFAVKAADEVPNWSAISNVVGGTPGDTEPPARVMDLTDIASDETSVTLTWTAPGDDTDRGTASEYDIRYSQGVIDADNFDTATAWPNPPTPQEGGSTETLVIDGLTTQQPYTFALKAADEVPNWSEMSVVVAVTPGQPDTAPPDDVADLTATVVDQTTVQLDWTAPGDDGMVGTVASYDIRQSASEITAANFADADPVIGPVNPVSGGETESLQATGLTDGQPYYFALMAVDNRDNWSGMSNLASVAGDRTWPADIADLTVGSYTATSVTLNFTAPGDDADQGTADAYDIRYSTTDITDEAAFQAATPMANPPIPQPAGTGESVLVDGLTDEQEYYFAVKTADEVPNWSGVSNVVFAPADRTPPDSITDLAVTLWGNTTVYLSWTAPGDDGNLLTASAYDIRYSTDPISDEASFALATPVANPPAPQAPGASESVLVDSQSEGVLHYFAVKTSDEVPNWSGLSNVESETPLDVTPPEDVTDLQVEVAQLTDDSVTLTWTTPGDDADQGTADAYDLRYCPAPFDYDSCPNTWTLPPPLVAGSIESTTIDSLITGQAYFFAVKTSDEVPLVSGLSNTVSATPGVAPADVTDLAATPVDQTSINLNWTAPGDDAWIGTISAYDIRMSTGDITNDTEFDAAGPVTPPAVPVEGGQPETVSVGGLTPDTTYYFALKAEDDLAQPSGMSNVAVGHTVDSVAPEGITDLADVAVTAGSVTLNWTAPGDNLDQGTADSYDIRYSTGIIGVNTNFVDADQWPTPPPPQVAGSLESVVITGLLPDQPYTFAIKTSDEVPNISILSNVDTAKTVDEEEPAAITDLAAVAYTTDSVTLEWTAPGDNLDSGTATTYDIRYSTGTIDDANFASADQWPTPPTPQVAGSLESVVITGLIQDQVYTFAIKTSDEVPNTSAISNVETETPRP